MSLYNYTAMFNRIEEIFLDCLFNENELVDGKPIGNYVPAQGIIHDFGFHPERLERHNEEIYVLINRIANIERGISLSDLCEMISKCQTNQRDMIEKLLSLSDACGFTKYLFPRSTWQYLPNNTPFIVKNSKNKRLIK